jgi:hypothetical protein
MCFVFQKKQEVRFLAWLAGDHHSQRPPPRDLVFGGPLLEGADVLTVVPSGWVILAWSGSSRGG